MCGIFGLIAKEEYYSRNNLIRVLEDLAKFSQVRGKDSSGIAFRFESIRKIEILRGAVSIDELIKTKEYNDFKQKILSEKKSAAKDLFVSLGHARLVTNGSQLQDENNQPVIKNGIVGVHNGIIVNEKELWKNHNSIEREYEIDTEILFALIRKYIKAGHSVVQSSVKSIKEVFGTVSTGFMLNDREEFVVFTNNGSLYILTDNKNLFVFASEKNILLSLKKKHKNLFESDFTFSQVSANMGYVIDYSNFKISKFNLKSDIGVPETQENKSVYEIDVINYHSSKEQLHAIVDSDKFSKSILAKTERELLEYNIESISKLKRCTKCVLPETFPYIEFDENGVCNICRNYKYKNQNKPISELLNLVEPYRKKNDQPDCLVPFSGGRDSTYVLHFVKKKLKLNPIAFTYDWGMVTDLARRNIARVCGKLGVENIIVAADIHKKRAYIRKNILAFLKKPSLGMIPLFMAGDKYFFKYANQVRKQNDIKLQIWGINFLENTDFKVGFAGVPPEWEKKMIYSMNFERQLKLFGYVAYNFLTNPKYFNSSLLDTMGSFVSRYLNPREDYFHFFDFHQWSEIEIEKILFDEYNWETANDIKSTWRIGDGTASFYNYIYYTVAGFSEFDTFRSNQIREGMISREKALSLINEENYPRYESLKWYLEILGLEFEPVIKKINQIQKLY